MPTAIPACHLQAPALPAVSVTERVFRAVLVLEKWTERARQRRALRELPEYVDARPRPVPVGHRIRGEQAVLEVLNADEPGRSPPRLINVIGASGLLKHLVY